MNSLYNVILEESEGHKILIDPFMGILSNILYKNIDKKSIMIDLISTRYCARKRGYARYLLDLLECDCNINEVSSISLITGNEPEYLVLRNIFQKWGFNFVASPREGRILMRKDL